MPKRPLSSEDVSSPSKRVQTRSFSRVPVQLPTPDSVADSVSPSRSISTGAGGRVPAGPANPGVIRDRHQGILSMLPADSDALETFAKLRKDGHLSDEEAFLKLIATFDVPLRTLNRISGNLLCPTVNSIFR
jgi:hypothetical protein